MFPVLFKEQLRQHQPVVFQILENGLKQGKLAHAYIFKGPKGTPKKETAILLAQSLVCEHPDGFACEECDSCQRIAEGHYTDLIILDGNETSIKKDHILMLQEQFNKTGLERSGKKIYILDHAENTTVEALNSLLKFLEEPSGMDTTAILIADQPELLLPTILSRCQMISFKPLSSEECRRLADAEMDQTDSYLLSNIVRDPQVMKSSAESDEYQTALAITRQFTMRYINDPYLALVYLQQNCITKDKEKDKAVTRWFLDLLLLFYQDCLSGRDIPKGWYQESILKTQAENLNIPALIMVLLESRDKLVRSFNLALILDQMIYSMKEGQKHG